MRLLLRKYTSYFLTTNKDSRIIDEKHFYLIIKHIKQNILTEFNIQKKMAT